MVSGCEWPRRCLPWRGTDLDCRECLSRGRPEEEDDEPSPVIAAGRSEGRGSGLPLEEEEGWGGREVGAEDAGGRRCCAGGASPDGPRERTAVRYDGGLVLGAAAAALAVVAVVLVAEDDDAALALNGFVSGTGRRAIFFSRRGEVGLAGLRGLDGLDEPGGVGMPPVVVLPDSLSPALGVTAAGDLDSSSAALRSAVYFCVWGATRRGGSAIDLTGEEASTSQRGEGRLEEGHKVKIRGKKKREGP